MTFNWHTGGKHFIYGSLTILALTVALFAYWGLAPKNILVINGTPSVKVVPGSPFVIEHISFCKEHSGAGVVEPRYVSSKTEVLLPAYAEKLPPGCQTVDVPVAIPPQAVPDSYHISYTITYKQNPIRTNIVNFKTQEFELQ